MQLVTNRLLAIRAARVLLAFLLLIGLSAACDAAPKPFLHPDFIYSHQLRQKTRIPTRVNLNRASLEELKTLPGMDENVALKVIRLRRGGTLKSSTDLYRIPYMEKREIDRLIRNLQNRISF